MVGLSSTMSTRRRPACREPDRRGRRGGVDGRGRRRRHGLRTRDRRLQAPLDRGTTAAVRRASSARAPPCRCRLRAVCACRRACAASLISCSDARLEIIARTSSSTGSTSCIASRPLKPDCPHLSQPATRGPLCVGRQPRRAAEPARRGRRSVRCGAAHAGQTRRTSRWATMPTSDEATMNGCMPRSNSRVIVAGASLVWSVLSSRWPVCAACSAMPAVSCVANLADEDDVGILAQDRPQAAGERQAGLGVDLHLVDAVELQLDRILERDDVVGRRLDRVERRVERGRLAAAGRAGHQDHALRPRQERSHQLAGCPAENPSSSSGRIARSELSSRMTIFSPNCVGRRRDAEIDAPALEAQPAAAVLRLAPFGDVHART